MKNSATIKSKHGGARHPGPGKEVRSHKRVTARRVNVLIEESAIQFYIALAGGGKRKLGPGIDKAAVLLADLMAANGHKPKPTKGGT